MFNDFFKHFASCDCLVPKNVFVGSRKALDVSFMKLHASLIVRYGMEG